MLQRDEKRNEMRCDDSMSWEIIPIHTRARYNDTGINTKRCYELCTVYTFIHRHLPLSVNEKESQNVLRITKSKAKETDITLPEKRKRYIIRNKKNNYIDHGNGNCSCMNGKKNNQLHQMSNIFKKKNEDEISNSFVEGGSA